MALHTYISLFGNQRENPVLLVCYNSFPGQKRNYKQIVVREFGILRELANMYVCKVPLIGGKIGATAPRLHQRSPLTFLLSACRILEVLLLNKRADNPQKCLLY
jgi:hypothetical protein